MTALCKKCIYGIKATRDATILLSNCIEHPLIVSNVFELYETLYKNATHKNIQ